MFGKAVHTCSCCVYLFYYCPAWFRYPILFRYPFPRIYDQRDIIYLSVSNLNAISQLSEEHVFLSPECQPFPHSERVNHLHTKCEPFQPEEEKTVNLWNEFKENFPNARKNRGIHGWYGEGLNKSQTWLITSPCKGLPFPSAYQNPWILFLENYKPSEMKYLLWQEKYLHSRKKKIQLIFRFSLLGNIYIVQGVTQYM